MAVAVELTHVTKAFDTTLAVNDVSLKIEKGEFFFLLGPSGCGKSTFLRIVAGFYKPDTGELRFDDTVVNNVPPHQRNTGMVFQNYALWPHMSVAENIEYGLTLRKLEKSERNEKITSALEMVQMVDYRDPAQSTHFQVDNSNASHSLALSSLNRASYFLTNRLATSMPPSDNRCATKSNRSTTEQILQCSMSHTTK